MSAPYAIMVLQFVFRPITVHCFVPRTVYTIFRLWRYASGTAAGATRASMSGNALVVTSKFLTRLVHN